MKTLFICALACLLFLSCHKKQGNNPPVIIDTLSGIITTYAGNGDVTWFPDYGTAATNNPVRPIAIACDQNGNLFISDQEFVIYKVNHQGLVFLLAGRDTLGYSGDGGPATAALIGFPAKIACDGHNNIYFADRENNRIRKINSQGIISTVAGTGDAGYSGDGGQATAATLNYPWGVAADNDGNIYIADTYNRRIRKVNLNGIISTVGGNGNIGYNGDGGQAVAAEINEVVAISVDKKGNVYLGDTNCTIRKIDGTGIIKTIAGDGARGFSGDGRPAVAAQITFHHDGIATDQNDNLYFTDELNHRVRKINASGIVTTIAGNGYTEYVAGIFFGGFGGDGGQATSSKLNFPTDVAVDQNGNVFIADYENHRVREVHK